ncbi:hypothetical protein F4801DRAFT_133439 [Xylaria longipes]|nr:hypothetical protein F4801DRAFT_133439 [Xylaria longipes]
MPGRVTRSKMISTNRTSSDSTYLRVPRSNEWSACLLHQQQHIRIFSGTTTLEPDGGLCVKFLVYCTVQNCQIQKAIAAIRSKEITSVREAARLFRVPRSTLQHRLAGAKSHAEAMEPYQRLTAAEEASIAKNDDTPLGRHWYSNFLA